MKLNMGGGGLRINFSEIGGPAMVESNANGLFLKLSLLEWLKMHLLG